MLLKGPQVGFTACCRAQSALTGRRRRHSCDTPWSVNTRALCKCYLVIFLQHGKARSLSSEPSPSSPTTLGGQDLEGWKVCGVLTLMLSSVSIVA